MRITTRVGRGTYLSVGGCGLLILTVVALGALGALGWLITAISHL